MIKSSNRAIIGSVVHMQLAKNHFVARIKSIVLLWLYTCYA
jgi:hypothetical protein